ncbi:helix-turn-helix domain-containing protein [Cellulosilyticum sp. I15G10I2]|uniref:helix-turn-helix domain-containing protein n=1 Tax=Cellulosilyticum sp. I15G10I2 TaxID=1892843 RepID=UPI00085C3A37|nr:helix-turn-helix transcriptional regulator [Cellulosilyticum sp. I15G10I2]
MSIVDRIQALCDAKNTTLIGLERAVNLGRGTIRKWDTNSPSIDKVVRVADYFHIAVDYLIDREENPLSSEILKIVSFLQDKDISPKKEALIMQYLETMFE